MENNDNTENKAIPQNSEDRVYIAPEKIIPQSTLENNLSQNLGTTIPTPEPQQQPLKPNTSPVTANIGQANDTPLNDSKFSPSANKRLKIVKIFAVVMLILLFGASIGGSYLFGKSHEKIVIQEPPIQPINLPPQAVVINECKVGRGKQYILPKDIPVGPIYDVVNSQVIAIEYSLDIAGLLSSSDVFSDTILKLTRDYPVNHLSIVPDSLDPEEIQRIQLIMFVLSKEEANNITCE